MSIVLPYWLPILLFSWLARTPVLQSTSSELQNDSAPNKLKEINRKVPMVAITRLQ
jgi:hypothetical protein